MKSTWFDEKLSQLENDLDFLTEEKILEFNEKVVGMMLENEISRSELAKRMGVSKPFVAKLLNGNANMTIRTMVHISNVMNCNLHLDICPKYIKPKTLCLIPSNDNYKQFLFKSEELEYASAA